MNLADIRKKADENKKSAVEPSGVIVEPVPTPEVDSSDYLFFEEPESNRFIMPEEEFPAEPCIDDVEVLTCSAPATETVVGINEHLPDPLSVSAAMAAPEEKQCQPVLSVPEPSAKGSTVFTPIEAILWGRESALSSEDHPDSQADAYVSEEIEEYLCFRVAHEEYAISIMAIKEIVKPRDVTEVPRMPAFVSGVISLRGVIIPIMDMRLRLSLPVGAATGKERIIVLRRDAGFCGVFVDEVIQVARFKKSDLEEPPAVLDGIDRDFVTGLGHFDNRMLILLNLAAILDIGVH